MIHDIIEVEPLDACVESAKRHVPYGIGRDVLTQIHATQLIVVTRLSIEQVDANLITVEADVPILLMMTFEEVENVDRVTQHQPSPTHIRTQLHARLRREHNLLSILIAQCVRLESVRILKHHRVVIVLGFDVFLVNTAETLNHLIHFVEKRLLFFDLRCWLGDTVFNADAVGHNNHPVGTSANGNNHKHPCYEEAF